MKSTKNFHAVLIGFNQYKDKSRLTNLKFAEKDALDLYELLTDPRYGNYPAENITLITGTELRIQLKPGYEYPERIRALVGGEFPVSAMETADIETILYTQIVNQCTPDDTVLVFYSGHGFIAGKHEKAYLATPDVSILNIQSNPKSGLQMEYLHNYIFKDTKAQYVLFLLDCCHSGAFCSEMEHKEEIDLKRLVESRYYTGEGRVALVSSPRNIVSRESDDYRNGVFTYHLLNGLKGAAAEPTGEVTIASLISYIQYMSPSSQPPVLYGNTTRFVVTHPDENTISKPIYKVYPANQFVSTHKAQPSLSIPLLNPLAEQIAYVDTVLKWLGTMGQDETQPVGDRILSSIRRSLEAEFAFIQRIEEYDSNIIYKYQSDLALKGFDLEEYKTLVIRDLYPFLTRKKKELLPFRYGFYRDFDGRKESHNYLVAVPLCLEYPREFLVLCGIDREYLKFGEIIGRVLCSVYEATNELTTLSLPDVETTILDGLKSDFGHVPYQIYERRFHLFKEKLKTVTFVYEPVVMLGKRKPEIHSWEALARDPNTQRAPVNLFQSTELWGPEFIAELDVYCLRNAVAEYIQLWEKEHPDRKLDPLSVNVYPDTLFRSVYKNEIRRIVEAENLTANRLILEISEKRPIPCKERIHEHMGPQTDPVEEFIRKIHEYTNELQVGFAMDDFGVGHSSISRLAKLELDHIKVDRDILLHPHPECTIEYVRNIVNACHSHPFKIIVEGFDGESRISLRRLYELGVRYIQGHMIRRAGHTVCDLSQEERNFIINELA